MDFEFTEDQLELRANARSVLEGACPPALVRQVFDAGQFATESVTDVRAELWSTLVDLDWPALGLPTECGGLGLGWLEVGIVVEELGRAVAPTPYLATITQFAAAVREAGSTWRLAEVASGECTGTLAVAERGRWEAEQIRTTASKTDSGWLLNGEKSHVLDGGSADEIAVVARGEAGLGLFVVPQAAVDATTPALIDPTMPTAKLSLANVEVASDRVLIEPGDPRAGRVIDRTLEEATTALALSTVATCRAIFETTLQYLKDREQFGRPIGSFQALKHRMADCYLAVERAASLAYFAALTIAEDDERRPVATAMAKAAASECQTLVTHDGLQLHGGVGFTWEHDLHFLLKRAKTGDLLFGTGATQRAHLAVLLGLAPESALSVGQPA